MSELRSKCCGTKVLTFHGEGEKTKKWDTYICLKCNKPTKIEDKEKEIDTAVNRE